MSRVRLSDRAKADIHAIWDYVGVARGSPAAAERQVEALYDKFKLPAAQPLLGELRDDLRPGLRLFVAGSYVILYYPIPDGVQVAGVVHGARDIESIFDIGQS